MHTHLLVLWAHATEKSSVCLTVLMEDAGVNGGGEEVIGGRDGVNVARKVQVHLLHRDHLT